MTSGPTSDDRFNLEVVKLLLKVAWVDQEVDAYHARVRAERASREQLDDAAAVAERLKVT